MKVQILSFHCVLKNRFGKILSSSFNHDVCTHSEETGPGRLPGLIAGLQNMKNGERKELLVSADQAYGWYDPKLVEEIAREELVGGHRLRVGQEIVRMDDAGGAPRSYRVTHSNPSTVTLDANHPFAGQDLIFDIEVVAAREALEEALDDTMMGDPSPLRH